MHCFLSYYQSKHKGTILCWSWAISNFIALIKCPTYKKRLIESQSVIYNFSWTWKLTAVIFWYCSSVWAPAACELKLKSLRLKSQNISSSFPFMPSQAEVWLTIILFSSVIWWFVAASSIYYTIFHEYF